MDAVPAAERPHPFRPRSIATPGGNIVAVCLRLRSPLDWEFATHTLREGAEVEFVWVAEPLENASEPTDMAIAAASTIVGAAAIPYGVAYWVALVKQELKL